MKPRIWAVSKLERVFPSTTPRASKTTKIDAALNERFSFQAAVRNEGAAPVVVSAKAQGPAGWQVRVRRVGYVPVRHGNTDTPHAESDGFGKIPGYVPDPLFDDTEIQLPPNETHAFWISVVPSADAKPGRCRISVVLTAAGKRIGTCSAAVTMHRVRIPKRRGFSITHWFYIDSLMDFYKTDHFDARFWEILEAYMKNVSAHGQDTIYVPVFTPPLDGVKRPSQLLKVRKGSNGRYAFDWSDVRKYTRLARKCGIENFEWCHPFTQWGVNHAIRIYEGQGKTEKLLWPAETGATSKTYRNFLSQYLPALKLFLKKEHLLNKSFFHVSDEPHAQHLDNYRSARALLKELAPWMKVMDALSDISFGREHLTDMPIPSISTALQFVEEDIPCWCYYCCFPRGRYLNRLIDTPLSKIAMHGFLFYRWPISGFLHWGYNYWYKSQTRTMIDPFSIQDGLKWPGWAYGDTFLVYPGANGPIDSIRWEVFGESLQDYALLQTLAIDRNGKLLRPLKSFENFPRTEAWLNRTRRTLLKNRSKAGIL